MNKVLISFVVTCVNLACIVQQPYIWAKYLYWCGTSCKPPSTFIRVFLMLGSHLANTGLAIWTVVISLDVKPISVSFNEMPSLS